MKTFLATALFLLSFSGGAMANDSAANAASSPEGLCATDPCDFARLIPSLPSDVQDFVDQRDGCDHFRGEPWDDGDEPEIKERREFIFQRIQEFCSGTDRRLAKLLHKYRHHPKILALLKEYDDDIEP